MTAGAITTAINSPVGPSIVSDTDHGAAGQTR
jgi:hypothetical protein